MLASDKIDQICLINNDNNIIINDNIDDNIILLISEQIWHKTCSLAGRQAGRRAIMYLILFFPRYAHKYINAINYSLVTIFTYYTLNINQ